MSIKMDNIPELFNSIANFAQQKLLLETSNKIAIIKTDIESNVPNLVAKMQFDEFKSEDILNKSRQFIVNDMLSVIKNNSNYIKNNKLFDQSVINHINDVVDNGINIRLSNINKDIKRSFENNLVINKDIYLKDISDGSTNFDNALQGFTKSLDDAYNKQLISGEFRDKLLYDAQNSFANEYAKINFPNANDEQYAKLLEKLKPYLSPNDYARYTGESLAIRNMTNNVLYNKARDNLVYNGQPVPDKYLTNEMQLLQYLLSQNISGGPDQLRSVASEVSNEFVKNGLLDAAANAGKELMFDSATYLDIYGIQQQPLLSLDNQELLEKQISSLKTVVMTSNLLGESSSILSKQNRDAVAQFLKTQPIESKINLINTLSSIDDPQSLTLMISDVAKFNQNAAGYMQLNSLFQSSENFNDLYSAMESGDLKIDKNVRSKDNVITAIKQYFPNKDVGNAMAKIYQYSSAGSDFDGNKRSIETSVDFNNKYFAPRIGKQRDVSLIELVRKTSSLSIDNLYKFSVDGDMAGLYLDIASVLEVKSLTNVIDPYSIGIKNSGANTFTAYITRGGVEYPIYYSGGTLAVFSTDKIGNLINDYNRDKKEKLDKLNELLSGENLFGIK